MEPDQTGAHPFPQVRYQNADANKWLTVSDAVIRCTERGLPRTPKTIRKWAARSHLSVENADISVRREDTENGFRWSIEAESLDRKIDEELEFEARRSGEPNPTGTHVSEPVRLENVPETRSELAPNTSEPVQTGQYSAVPLNGVEGELRAQLKHTQEEVQFLRDELKHRRKTDEALGSVIEAFRLNSETTQSRLLEVQSGVDRPNGAGKPRHDIVHNNEDRIAE